MGRWFLCVAVLWGLVTVFPASLQAETQVERDVTALSQTLLIPEAMQVLRDEGIANGRTLIGDAAGGDMSFWNRALDRVYEPAKMLRLFNQAFAQALAEDDATIAAATRFYASERSQRALRLEISARRALLDKDVEKAAQLAYDKIAKEQPARQALIDRFVAANDLIDTNVMGAMNANLAFLRGMAASEVEGFDLTEAEMLAQVWGTEAETRAEAEGWLLPFLTMAYEPISDADLAAYIEFSESPAGKRLNTAWFAGFDAMLNQLSHELGLAYGQSLRGDDI